MQFVLKPFFIFIYINRNPETKQMLLAFIIPVWVFQKIIQTFDVLYLNTL